MSDKKLKDLEGKGRAPRARNKTVMLTPEIANEMRSRLSSGVHQNTGTEEISSSVREEVKELVKSASVEAPVQNTGTEEISKEVREEVKSSIPASAESRLDNSNGAFEKPSEALFSQPVVDEVVEEKESIIENFVAEPQEEVVEEAPVIENFIEEEQMSHEEIKINEPVSPVEQRRASASVRRSAPPQQEVATEGDYIDWVKESPLCGFLVSFDNNPNGDVYQLHTGRLIVTSEVAGTGSLLFLDDESVSSMHAIVRISNKGEIQVLDQLSEAGTKIERKDGEVLELSGDKSDLHHGDLLSFGDRSFKVCLIDG